MTPKVRVVLSDDESLFRACLRHLFEVPARVISDVYGVRVGSDFQVVGEAGTGEDLVRVIRSTEPDLVILEPDMPRMSGLEALRELRAGRINVRAALLADRIDRTQLLSAIQLGVRGFVLKDSTTTELFEAIVSVMADNYWLERTLMTDLVEWVGTLTQQRDHAAWRLASSLTRRQREVLMMVSAGYPNKDIASRFSVSEETIKHHLTRIFEKVGASNRLELAMVATQCGLDRTV
jgi:DNA-binding NarL/FixJ family response regulator